MRRHRDGCARGEARLARPEARGPEVPTVQQRWRDAVVHALRVRFSGRERRRSAPGARSSMVLYVEGAQDRGVLEVWARRVSTRFGQEVARAALILGGRRTGRAATHFRRLRARRPELRGVCILDRDDVAWLLPSTSAEPGLDILVWPRRQIESYLLVPAAIRRSLRLARHDHRLERFLQSHLPPLDDEAALRSFDAKRVIGPNGALSAALRTRVQPTRIARCMSLHELHDDVLEALHRVGLGPSETTRPPDEEIA